MSSILASIGVVFATAMAAVSGTVILLAFRLQKSLPTTATTSQFSIIVNSSSSPRPCLSSVGKKREKKKKKKVHFAEDVVDPVGNSDEFRRRQHRGICNSDRYNSSTSGAARIKSNGGDGVVKMPANRMALYNEILRDRVLQRVGYSY